MRFFQNIMVCKGLFLRGKLVSLNASLMCCLVRKIVHTYTHALFSLLFAYLLICTYKKHLNSLSSRITSKCSRTRSWSSLLLWTSWALQGERTIGNTNKKQAGYMKQLWSNWCLCRALCASSWLFSVAPRIISRYSWLASLKVFHPFFIIS